MTVFEFLTDVFKRVIRPNRDTPTLLAAGRTYVYSDAAQRYEPQVEADTVAHAPAVLLADAESLVAWCQAIERKTAGEIPGQVVISRVGTTRANTPVFVLSHVGREVAEKAFYLGFCPWEKLTVTLTYEQLLTWVELLGERLQGAESIALALKSVSATDGSATKVEQNGAVITIRAESEKGVTLDGKMPKRLRTLIPFGDPECEVPVEWGLQIALEGKSPRFTLTHLVSDGAFDAYAAWMRGRLGTLAADSWLVVVGP